MLISFSLFCSAPSSSAQDKTRTVTATFDGLIADKAEEMADQFVFQYADEKEWIDRVAKRGAVIPNDKPRVGTLKWVVPETEFATGNLDRSFRAFSAEAPVGARLGKPYLYEIRPFNHPSPEWFGLKDDAEGKKKAELRAVYVRELYGRYYAKTLTDRVAARAFQAALWELFHETKPAPFDLVNGAFVSRDLGIDPDKAPEHVRKAQAYLKSLRGDDEIYDEKRKDWNYRVLVHLKGLSSPLADGEVGPALLAFQYAERSASKLSPNAYGVGSGLGVGGDGNGGGDNSNFGGGGASLGSPSDSSLSQTPNVSPGGGPPGGAGGGLGGPIRVPPQPTHGDPIHGSRTITIPSSSVPAPSSIYLGLIAIGAWFVRSGVARAIRKKFQQ
jgi:hypothetical protein